MITILFECGAINKNLLLAVYNISVNDDTCGRSSKYVGSHTGYFDSEGLKTLQQQGFVKFNTRTNVTLTEAGISFLFGAKALNDL